MDIWLQRTLDMALAFRQSRIILTAVELDLFTQLGEERLTAKEIAGKLKTSLRGTGALLDALAGLGILRKEECKFYANTPEGRRFLDRASPEFRGAILDHVARVWAPWQQLTAEIRSGRAAVYSRPPNSAEFAWAMYHVGLETAEEVISLLDLKGVRKALDFGGGAGHYALALARRSPACKVSVFDRAETLRVATQILHSHPDLQPRVTTLAGDFLTDDIGRGYDLILASHIIHSFTKSDVKNILKTAFRALRPGGRLVINDYLLDDSRTRPAEAAVFSVHMLVMTRGGCCYSVGELSRWLKEAGFTDCRHFPVGSGPTSLLVARKTG